MKQDLFLILLFISFNANAQFAGNSGVYYLGSAGTPIPAPAFTNPGISGIVVRFRWGDLETSPGIFNWAFIDGEIAKAVSNNKKVSLQPLAVPDWMGALGAEQYYYIDENTFHSTYGQVVSDVLPWDTIYVNRYKILLQNLAGKYAANTTVSYVNTVGGAFSRNLPDTVITDTVLFTKEPFWTAYNYNADSLSSLVNEMTDYYMNLFPATPLWCSVDYVRFEQNASGRLPNYLASVYTSYGISHYPERFGLWREDISGCNPQPTIPAGSQWHIMQQNPCRTGAQMLWNVQDGPARMNRCGILPNSKTVVLDSAVNKALNLAMRYLEIYAADITDVSLASSIQQANTKLINQQTSCTSVVPVTFFNFKGNCINGNAVLEWATVTESSNNYCWVEKSSDGITWAILERISGTGMYSGTSSYSYTDRNTGNSHYYRIKQAGADNRNIYSPVIYIHACGGIASAFSIYPNPVQEKLTIVIAGPQTNKMNTIRLYNSAGVLLKQIDLSQTTAISVATLPAGLYFITSNNFPGQHLKFVKD